MRSGATMYRVWDSSVACEASACRNDTETSWRFFSGTFGPHGYCQPGNWAVTDDAGFSIEVTPEEFDRRFVVLRELEVV